MENKRYQSLLKIAPFGYAYHRIILDENGCPSDYEFLEANAAFETLTGLNANDIIGKKISEIIPEIYDNDFDWIAFYGDIALKGGQEEIEQYSQPLNKWFKIQITSTKKHYFSIFFTDVSHHHYLIEAVKALHKYTPENIDYSEITESMRRISGARYAVFNRFEEDGKDFTTKAISGLQPNIEKATQLLGFGISGRKWKYDPVREEKTRQNKITHFEHLEELTGQVIPRNLVRLLANKFHISRTILIKITRDGLPEGDFTLLFADTPISEKLSMAENYADSVGMLMHRITAEKGMKAQKQELENFFSVNLDLLCIADQQGNFIKVNREWENLLGYPIEMLEKSNYLDFVHPEDIDATREAMAQLSSQHIITGFTNRYRCRDGSYRHLEWRTHIHNSHQYASARDVTEHIQSEENIRKSEQRMRSLFEQTNDAVFIIDLDGNYLETNKRAAEMFGFSHEEMQTLSVQDLSSEPAESQSVVTKLLRGEKIPPYIRHFLRKNKTEFPAEINVQLVYDKTGEPLYIQSVVRDITHRYQEQEFMRARDALLQKLSLQVPGVIFQFQLYNEGKFFFPYASESLKVIFEIAREDLNQNAEVLFSRVHSQDKRMVRDSIVESYLSLTQWTLEFRIELPGKRTRWLSGTANPEKQDDGSVLWYGYISDITTRKQEEQKLQYLKEQFELAVDGSNDGIWDWNIRTNELFLSPRWKEMLGYTDDELKNEYNSFASLIHPDDYQHVLQYINSYFKGSVNHYEIDFRMRHKNGSVRWISARGAAVRDESGKPYRMAGSHTDITERKTAEENLQRSEEKFRSLVESLNDIIYTLDGDLRYSGVFGHWINTIGLTEETFLGKTAAEIFGKKKAAEHNRAATEALKGKVITYEWQMPFDREIAYYQTTLSPIYNKEGVVTGLSGAGRNITSTKRAAELEKEMQLTRNTVEFKQKFLASMSHEIRTPLTGVLGVTELLENTSLNKTQEEYLDILKSSSENLRKIIDQVLDYSRIEAGKVRLHIHDFPVSAICSSAENLFRSMCRKPITFHFTVDPALPDVIKADEKRITQVINNMLANAIKYTEQGSISLDIRFHSRLDAEEYFTEVSITDTGAGIEKSKYNKIFKPFSNIHSIDSANYEGAGLALSICKELVELHGGTIGFDSLPGKGSRFWFTFKTKIAEDATAAENTSPANLPAKPLKILVAEDKIMTQKIVKILLSNMGHSVSLANNGKEAFEQITPGKFDLVLMDIQMPVMDGITATRKLREKFPSGLPPIVGFSANNFEGDREKYMEDGLDEFLSKPLKKENFQRITQIFSLNRE